MGMHGRRPAGFTLVELMITLTILAILAAIGLPAMADVVRNNHRAVLVNELLASFMFARSETARTGQPIVICGFDDANGNRTLDVAERACAGTDWRDGWLVARWNDADADRLLDSGELDVPVRSYVNDYDGYRVTGSDFTDAPAAGAAALMPFNGLGSSARLTVCDPRGAARARAVDVAASGKALVRVNDAEDAQGVALACP